MAEPTIRLDDPLPPYDPEAIAQRKVKTEPGKFFVDRIEDNGVAVLLGPNGEKVNMPAQKGWKEGQYIAPPSAPAGKPGQNPDAGGFYLAPPTGMTPEEMTPIVPAANGRRIDTNAGQYLDNHDKVPGAALQQSQVGRDFTEPVPSFWGSPEPMPPVLPARPPGAEAGPSPPGPEFRDPADEYYMPPEEYKNAPRVPGGFMQHMDPALLAGEPDPIVLPRQASMSSFAPVPMPSGRGRTRTRRKRPVP